MNNYVYNIDTKLYINLTNRCSNNCDFCIRKNGDNIEGKVLWLDNEPTADDIIEQLPDNLDDYDEEIVFCGYGEPTYNMEAIEEVAQYLSCIDKKVRLNTNGQALLIAGDEALSIIADCCDVVSVSLNASNADRYDQLCHSQYGKKAYNSIMEFVKGLKNRGCKVILSIVDVIDEGEISKCQQVAQRLNVPLRIRAKE